MEMVNRYSNSGSFRYGFNGKEKDNEDYGEGNAYDYGFRIYNPRIGRFLSTDPLSSKFPWYTPYQFAGNKPIWAVDLDGQEDVKYTDADLQNTMAYQTYSIKASITNTIIRLSPVQHYLKLREEFAKVGITDNDFISNFQIRMRTIVTTTPPNELDPQGSFTIENKFVVEHKTSFGREFLEAAFDILSTASIMPGKNSTGIFAAQGGGQFVMNEVRASMGILYNVRRLSTIGINTGLQGIHKLQDIMEAGMAFVGKNANKIYAEGGRFIGWESNDGLKRFRPSAYKKSQVKYQANFEQRTSVDVKWDNNAGAGSRSNMHVDVDQGFDFSRERLPGNSNNKTGP